MRYFKFLLFLTLVIMSHVNQAAPSLDIEPNPIEFKPLDPYEVLPGKANAFTPYTDWMFSFGYATGQLIKSDETYSGFIGQAQYQQWLRLQTAEQGLLGLQLGFKLPCFLSLCSGELPRLFLSSYMQGSDQLVNFVDYNRYKLIYSISFLNSEKPEKIWNFHLDVGFGLIGYVAGIYGDLIW